MDHVARESTSQSQYRIYIGIYRFHEDEPQSVLKIIAFIVIIIIRYRYHYRFCETVKGLNPGVIS